MRRTLFIAFALAGVLALTVARAQQPGKTASGKVAALTPIDYIEIRQLAARYGHAVDQGAESGYAYADLFAPDGTFGQTKGRDELATLAKRTAKGPQTAWHFIVNHTIEPTEDGAKGKEYLLHLRYGEPGQPNIVWGGGHYEDTYAKTPTGWRFKTRQFIRSEGTPESLKPPASASPAAPGSSLAAVPAAQSGPPVATPSSNGPALTARDYAEIEQLVYKYGWALDSGENNGFAYADLYASDGTFTGTNQGPSGRTYQGRENLAALARGGKRGPLYVSHFVTNVVVTPTTDGAVGRVYVGIFDLGEPGKSPAVGHGGFYDDVYVKTDRGWRIKKRSYYESRWGEANVQVPPAIPAVRALQEAKAAPAPAAKGSTLTAQDYVDLQQLVARYPYALDMNNDNGASYANGFTPDGTFGCILPGAGAARLPGVPDRCVTSSGPPPQAQPRAKGHEALARMVNTEEPHGPNYARHFIFNHVIEPTAGGAKGKEYAAVIDIAPGQQAQAHSIYLVGRYDDEYVKTPQGWRFKNRVFSAAARREAPATK